MLTDMRAFFILLGFFFFLSESQASCFPGVSCEVEGEVVEVKVIYSHIQTFELKISKASPPPNAKVNLGASEEGVTKACHNVKGQKLQIGIEKKKTEIGVKVGQKLKMLASGIGGNCGTGTDHIELLP